MIEPGQEVSHYKIVEILGGGGMGVVYKAEDTRLKRTVALKFLPPMLTSDPEAKERLVHEAQAASALEHANICSVHQIAEHDGQTFIVMGYYEGETLKGRVEGGGLKIENALDIAIQIAQGLSRAHEAGIVHRDIKPANIMLTSHGEAKILDFGLARVSGRTLMTKAGTTLGTAAYMSPEQARGEPVDQRTDIWSLGVVMYEMLTGKRPFQSDYEQALVYAILNQDPKPIRSLRPEVPEVVEQIALKAMAKAPESRYQNVEDLLTDLKSARGGAGQSGVTIASAEAKERKRKKRRTRMLVAGGAAVLILAGVLLVALPLIQDQALASNPRTLAFISFQNKTGDEALGYLRGVLPDVLGTSLEDSKYFRVIRSARIRELMKQIGKDTVEFIDRETGLLLCRRAGIDVLGAGSYTKAGPLFMAEIELVDVDTGERLGSSMKSRGRGEESLLEPDGIVEDLAGQVSRGMGVSQLSTQASVRGVAEVSSRSLQAQRYYQRGKLEWEKFNWKEARSFLELAVTEDSSFALAWQLLVYTHARMGNVVQAESCYSRAVRLASQVTERERWTIASIDSGLRASLLGREVSGLEFFKARTEKFPFDAEFRLWYAMALRQRGEISKATLEFERVLQLDKAHPAVLNELGYCYAFDGQGEKAIHALERYAELQPGDPNPFHSLAECQLMLGRFDEGITACERALKVKPDFEDARLTLAKLHFMNEEYDEAATWADREAENAPSLRLKGRSHWYRAWYLVWSGRLKEAEVALGRAERLASPQRDERNLAWIHWLRAWCAYEEGDWKKARLQISRYSDRVAIFANRASLTWLHQFCLGLVDVREGKFDSIDVRMQSIRETVLVESRRLRQDSEDYRRLTECGRTYPNALKGAYLLATHRASEIRPDWTARKNWAVQNPDSLTTASWPLFFPWGGNPSTIVSFPIPFDIIPRAYIERGMIDSAIASYERALKKPPHVLGPIIPRYYYRLARLYEQQGMREKAIENYTTFLKVWGKADPLYREPADARRRLAALKRQMGTRILDSTRGGKGPETRPGMLTAPREADG